MENINQTPNLQPIEPISPVKNQNLFKYLFIASVFILLVVIIAFYFVLNNKINQLSNKQTTEITPIPTQTQITETNTEIVPTIASTESTLAEKDSVNNLYTNNKVGFSLTIPKTVKQASCQKIADFYSLNAAENSEETSINFFESNDTVYLAGNHFYNLTGEQKIPQGQGYISKYSNCPRTITTFDQIQINDHNYTIPSSLIRMKIYAANIKSDNELEQFIKSKFGSGCKLGQKTKITNSDIYSVKVLGDGKDLGETQCPINFVIDLKYNQTKGKLVIFELGQSCSFYKENVSPYGCYDDGIVNSLKFN